MHKVEHIKTLNYISEILNAMGKYLVTKKIKRKPHIWHDLKNVKKCIYIKKRNYGNILLYSQICQPNSLSVWDCCLT